MYIVEVLYKTYMLVLYFEAFSVSPLSVNFICDVGVALLVGYLLFTVIDAEKDVTGFETDL